METFWENIRDGLVLLLKVCGILFFVDLVLRGVGSDIRIPYILQLTNWLMYHLGLGL